MTASFACGEKMSKTNGPSWNARQDSRIFKDGKGTTTVPVTAGVDAHPPSCRERCRGQFLRKRVTAIPRFGRISGSHRVDRNGAKGTPRLKWPAPFRLRVFATAGRFR